MISKPAANPVGMPSPLLPPARGNGRKRTEPETPETREDPPPKRVADAHGLHELNALTRSTIYQLAGETHSQILRHFAPLDIEAYSQGLEPGLQRPAESAAAELCLQIAEDSSFRAIDRHLRLVGAVPAAFRHQPLDDILRRLLERSERPGQEPFILALAWRCVDAARGLLARRSDALARICRRIEWRIGMRNINSLTQFDAMLSHLGGLKRSEVGSALLEGMDALQHMSEQQQQGPNRWSTELEARVMACVDGADVLPPAERIMVLRAAFALSEQADQQAPTAWAALPGRLQQKLRQLPLPLLYEALSPLDDRFFDTVRDMLLEKPAKERGAWFGLLTDAMPAQGPDRAAALINLGALLQNLPAEDILPQLERLAQETVEPTVDREFRDDILFELVGPESFRAMPPAQRKNAFRILLTAMEGAELTAQSHMTLTQELVDRLALVPDADRNEVVASMIGLG